MALLAMAIHDLGVRGALVHRLAGRRHHHVRRTARRASSTSRPAGSRRARRGRDRDRRRLPGRAPGHQGHHHARPRRLRHHGGRARRRARRRRLRDLHRRRRRLHRRPAHRARTPGASSGSPTRRCSSWPRAAPRCCTCAASSTPAASTCRSTCGRRSRPSTGTDRRPDRGRTPVEQAHHLRRRARPQRGQDHRGRRARQAGRGGARSSRRWPRAEINIDMIVQNVSPRPPGSPTSRSRCPRPTARPRIAALDKVAEARSASSRCSTTTRSARSR